MSTQSKQTRTMNYNRTVGALYLTVNGKEAGAYWVDAARHELNSAVRVVRLEKFAATKRPGAADRYSEDDGVTR